MIARWLLLAVASTTAVQATVRADDRCGPGEPSCYEPHVTGGCLQPQCCEFVCEIDDFCCAGAWDEACVKLAEGLCTDVVCPEEGECLEVHDGAGCIDEDCCEFVRLHDPFCGFGTWDALCVDEATRWCDAASIECPIVPPAEAQTEGEPCLERTNDGCGVEFGALAVQTLECGAVVYGKTTTASPRDVDWYLVSYEGDGEIAVTLRSEFPARLLLLSGGCEGPLRTDAVHANDACGESTFRMTPPNGADWYLVVESGVAARVVRSGLPCDEIDPDDPPEPGEEPPSREYGLHYLLLVDCGPTCDGDLDGDGVVGGADLGRLFVEWGPCTGCVSDLNGDGVVDGTDLGRIFVDWGDC